jgi:Zn-dependent protease
MENSNAPATVPAEPIKQKSIPKKTVAYILLALKSKKLFSAILLLKSFKFAKPLVTIITLVISLFSYSLAYSVSLAASLIVMMFVHELGHVYAINRLGLKAGRMIFIPFLGAMVAAPEGMSRRQEAVVGIGGPWLGSIFAILFVAAYSVTGIQWFLAAGFMGVLLNLFNMIPVTPFDGGRVMQIASKWCNVVGMAILVIITIALKVPTLLVVWMLAIFDMNVIGSKLRIILMSVIEVAMVYMLCTGIGIEGKATFWWMLVDVILGLAFVVAMLLSVVWVGANETNTILNE